MMPRIEGCGDGPEAIIGCGHILDAVAKDMVCWFGTDCGVRIAAPSSWNEPWTLYYSARVVFNPLARVRPSVACALAV